MIISLNPIPKLVKNIVKIFSFCFDCCGTTIGILIYKENKSNYNNVNYNKKTFVIKNSIIYKMKNKRLFNQIQI